MRLIDADKLDQFLENAEIEAHHKIKYVLEGAINTLRGNIRTFPAIEPERKTGKWYEDEAVGLCRCDQCNGVNLIYTPFCPMCGAEMEEDDGK